MYDLRNACDPINRQVAALSVIAKSLVRLADSQEEMLRMFKQDRGEL